MQLDQLAYVHPNLLANNLDISWCRYSYQEREADMTPMGLCSAILKLEAFLAVVIVDGAIRHCDIAKLALVNLVIPLSVFPR